MSTSSATRTIPTEPRSISPGRHAPRWYASTAGQGTPGQRARLRAQMEGEPPMRPPDTNSRHGPSEPGAHDDKLKPRRGRGDDGISWDKANKCHVGTVSLGYDATGKRIRRTVRGRTKAEVKDKLDALHDEIKAGIRTPATYTVEQCVRDWLDSLKPDPETVAGYRGQAEKWIYPKIGKAKLKDLRATEVEKFFNECGKALSKRSLIGLKSTLRRS